MKNLILFIVFSVLFSGCHPLSGKKKYITRAKILIDKNTTHLVFPESRKQQPPEYLTICNLLKRPPSITKRSFQCKGNGQCQNMIYDCKGIFEHGLPLRDNKEFIQPCLIEILNYIIQKSGEKITIVQGHICPQHNKYLNPTITDLQSKHLIGAAVIFIPGKLSENKLEELIKRYYQFNTSYKQLPEYMNFTRTDRELFNKEIVLRVTPNSDGTLLAYLEVLFDKEQNIAIALNEQSIQNYLRY